MAQNLSATEAAVTYTTYVNVPQVPRLQGRLEVKQKGEQFKTRWVILKGPGLSAFKLLADHGDGHPVKGNIKFSIDLGKQDMSVVQPPDKYSGRHIIAVKPGKGLQRCFIECRSASDKTAWLEAVRESAEQARRSTAILVTVPQGAQSGQSIRVQFPPAAHGTGVREASVTLPAGIKAGQRIMVRAFPSVGGQPPTLDSRGGVQASGMGGGGYPVGGYQGMGGGGSGHSHPVRAKTGSTLLEDPPTVPC